MIVWFASGNAHKRQEIAAILRSAVPDLDLRLPADAGLSFEPEENGASFLENALIKARALHHLLAGAGRTGPVLADDSGLCVDALGGRPGIYSARYGSNGRYGSEEGKPLSSEARNDLLRAELGAAADRRARFVCAMVLLYENDRFFAVEETLEGEILRTSRGTGGFGYDPVMYLPEQDKTVAELTEAEKNRVSHRGKAGRAIAILLAASALT
jgi:XTP/dITP diphosphohydrolase